ncbi:hypothetical protein OBB00_05890 [Gammaproteobacteria bacterium]|nr:hypothetical protein [Gammaproteobacteria bacterium]
MKTVALVAAAACLAFALNLATGLNAFLDLTSIVFTAVPILAAFVAVGFKRHGTLVVADIALQTAIIGMLIGSVGLLQNMSDPKALSFAFAIMFLMIFYGLLVAAICSLLSSSITEPISVPSIWHRAAGVLLWAVVVTYAMDSAAGLEAFFDPTSLLIVAALSLTIFGASASEELRSLARYLPVAGFLGVLVGFIVMLQNMSNPKAIGPAMAIALLTLTYCNLISVALKLTFPETILQERATHFTYLGFVLLFVIGIYSVLALSFI